jgi:lysozyme
MRITKASKLCIELIKHFESLHLNAYLCPANIWTIGFGNTFYEDNTRVKQGDKISEARAIQLLMFILEFFEKQVDNMTRDDLSQHQFDALVSFAYNVGHGNLKSSTLLRKVNANALDETIWGEFIKWDKASGKSLLGLKRRRNAEAHLFVLNQLHFYQNLK